MSALFDIAGDDRSLLQDIGVYAANGGGVGLWLSAPWASTIGSGYRARPACRRSGMARNRVFDHVVAMSEIVQRMAIDIGVAVKGQHARQQLVAEAVHDRQHADQGRDRQRYADKADDGDDRDAAILALGTQVLERKIQLPQPETEHV